MNICIITTHFPPAWNWGGPVRSMWNLARGLSEFGANVIVLTTNAMRNEIVEVPKARSEGGVTIITSPVLARGRSQLANRFGLSASFWNEIFKGVRFADIVHINGFWGSGPMIGALACAAWKRPYVLSTRGNLQENAINDKKMKKRLAFQFGVEKALKNASALHYTTQLEREWAPEWARTIHSVIVPNPMEIRSRAEGNHFRAENGIDNSVLLIGSIGRIHRRKGFEILAKALGKISRKDLIWAVVGADEGFGVELSKLVKEHGIESQIKITGPLKGEKLDQAYAAIDILVLPAHGENFGNVVAEAAIQGTPSIVSDQLGLMDWINEKQAGIVLPLEVNAWAEALMSLERHEILDRWHPERIREAASASFSIESVAKQMFEHYERIIAEHRK